MGVDEVEALRRFYPNYPREVAWKFALKDGGKGFTRNRYVQSAEELYENLDSIKYDFFASVYAFRDSPKFGKPWNRDRAIIDRVFFDFDSEDNPSAALREVKKLIERLGAKPIVVFSGKKGFHVYIVFREVAVNPKTVRQFALKVVEKLKLKTCDPAVFEVARLSRVPFSIHSATDLMCTTIDAERLEKMTYRDVLRFVKSGKWDFPDYELDEDFAELLEAFEVVSHETNLSREAARPITIPNVKDWRKRRIAEYTEALKRYGTLTADPRIRARHALSDWVATHGRTLGSVEHIARVHFVLLMIEEGFSDEEIHKVLRYAKDYTPERTQYFIDYNRKRKSEHSTRQHHSESEMS